VSGPFEVPVDGGVVRGARAGSGAPALLLHGGPALQDYMGECAEALAGLFSSAHYTQRGIAPSEAPPPYTIEQHAADAIAVLDELGIERAWAIGHSWGGHLALHLLVLHPERLLGVLCIDGLGADGSIFSDFDASLAARMTADELAAKSRVEERRRSGDVSEEALLQRLGLVWPHYFADGRPRLALPTRIAVPVSIESNSSLADHFSRKTLILALPSAELPALFVHGEDDPLPLRSTTETAALIPGARVETIPDCGHFPWLERPEAFRAAVERLVRGSGA
jgi:pimeloyl-ACP methyl ester carboxylesterase